jgi:hypothetical protein
MATVPAFCRSCGAVFASAFSFENARNVSFENCESGPCPKCGGTGRIPDGVYDFAGNTTRLLSGPVRSVEQLRWLQRVVQGVRDASPEKPAAEVLAQAEAERPDLGPVLLWLKEHDYLAAWLGVLLAVILSKCSQEPTQPIQNIINVAVQQQVTVAQGADGATPVRRSSPKVGRNDACPCGSGKKFKKCHGAS